MLWSAEGKKAGTLMSALVAAMVLLSGCTSPGEDVEGVGDDATVRSAQGETIGASDATLALQKMGYADPYHDVEPNGDVKEFDIWMDHEAVIEPHGDRRLFAFAFTDDPDKMGTTPGPEIRVTQGDTVRVNLHDPHDLEGHTMHWHGVDVPWEMDGVPFVTQDISMGQEGTYTYTYEFVARQPGTYWYHCVFAFPAHVDAGMFGAFIVEPQDPSEDLPFDREETLILHEADSQMFLAAGWAINPNMDPDPGQLPSNPFDVAESLYGQGRAVADVADIVVGDATGVHLTSEGPRDHYPAWSPRYKPNYDTFMIDGKSYPDTEPVYIGEGETLRLRFINAGQLHKSMHLHGHKMLVTHIDGYPLPQPHWEDTLSLAPGERKDVYVQGTNPGVWGLHDHSGGHQMGSTATNDYAFPGGMMTKLVYEGFDHPDDLPYPEGEATAGDFALFAQRHQVDSGGR